ncbi:MAG: rhodanese-like domain-containing protein [Moorea sp. SIO2B7]|nr:rhodanese-like domain-containing protein [Moorena sp. SIO2B7]
MTQMLILSFMMGLIGGAIASTIILKLQTKTPQDLIKEFYAVETAVHVSPHHLRKHMAQGDDSFILVDLRSQQEYEKEHIIGAINIPAYVTPEQSAYGDVERIVTEFSKLSKNKEIIVYCYSMPCMTGRKIGKMLADKGIFVKHLVIGWNEWRYFWDLWNHEHEWEQIKVEDYVATSKNTGKIITETNPNTCTIEGNFSC